MKRIIKFFKKLFRKIMNFIKKIHQFYPKSELITVESSETYDNNLWNLKTILEDDYKSKTTVPLKPLIEGDVVYTASDFLTHINAFNTDDTITLKKLVLGNDILISSDDSILLCPSTKKQLVIEGNNHTIGLYDPDMVFYNGDTYHNTVDGYNTFIVGKKTRCLTRTNWFSTGKEEVVSANMTCTIDLSKNDFITEITKGDYIRRFKLPEDLEGIKTNSDIVDQDTREIKGTLYLRYTRSWKTCLVSVIKIDEEGYLYYKPSSEEPNNEFKTGKQYFDYKVNENESQRDKTKFNLLCMRDEGTRAISRFVLLDEAKTIFGSRYTFEVKDYQDDNTKCHHLTKDRKYKYEYPCDDDSGSYGGKYGNKKRDAKHQRDGYPTDVYKIFQLVNVPEEYATLDETDSVYINPTGQIYCRYSSAPSVNTTPPTVTSTTTTTLAPELVITTTTTEEPEVPETDIPIYECTNHLFELLGKISDQVSIELFLSNLRIIGKGVAVVGVGEASTSTNPLSDPDNVTNANKLTALIIDNCMLETAGVHYLNSNKTLKKDTQVGYRIPLIFALFAANLYVTNSTIIGGEGCGILLDSDFLNLLLSVDGENKSVSVKKYVPDFYIYNNTFRGCNRTHNNNAAVVAYYNYYIGHNSIIDCASYCINVGLGVNTGIYFADRKVECVEYNYIEYTPEFFQYITECGVKDVGAIYTHTNNQKCVIRNNIINGFSGRGIGCRGIYTDDSSYNVYVYKNAVYNVPYGYSIDSYYASFLANRQYAYPGYIGDLEHGFITPDADSTKELIFDNFNNKRYILYNLVCGGINIGGNLYSSHPLTLLGPNLRQSYKANNVDYERYQNVIGTITEDISTDPVIHKDRSTLSWKSPGSISWTYNGDKDRDASIHITENQYEGNYMVENKKIVPIDNISAWFPELYNEQ